MDSCDLPLGRYGSKPIPRRAGQGGIRPLNQPVKQALGYVVALAMCVSGVLVLTGYILRVFIQTEQLRLVFGSVLILYGVFRFVSAYYTDKRNEETRSILEDDSWRNSGSTSG